MAFIVNSSPGPGLRFEPRGLVHAKGKGDLRMYFVERA